MKALIAGLLLLVACDHDIEMFPVMPGGGGGSSGTGFVDAGFGGDAGDAGNTINARVCLLVDARFPTTCANTGAGNLMVSLGSFTATTADDGSFTIMRPTSSNLVWRVSGDSVFPSAMSFGTLTSIPALDLAVYLEMVGANNVTPPVEDGQIIAKVLRGTTPISNVTATTDPISDVPPLYDGGDAVHWQGNATGQLGSIWVPGVRPPSAQLNLRVGTTDLAPVVGIPLFQSTVTFVFAEFP
ncbi:MAG: hypothetical protein HOV81_28740 [Kofleriaceae bacterium]|nr:hypothetical protein [Kofleriaceae bacterium]